MKCGIIDLDIKERYQITSKGLGNMRITITGRNIDITDGLRSAVEDKLSKLEKYFTPRHRCFFCNLKCRKRETENRGHHTGKRKYHPFRAG